MSIDRRKVLKAASAVTVGAFLPNVAIAADDDEAAAFEAEFEAVVATVRTALLDGGYAELKPHPIVTGDLSANGGLRHNPDPSMLRAGSFTIQPCARVGDIAERDRADLLPLFHTLSIRINEGEQYDAQVARAYELLTQTCGLDPSRVAFATVPEAEFMRRPLSEVGWDYDEKVLLRDPNKARGMNDGSGYFEVIAQERMHILTMGIYYRLTEGGDPNFSEYPPSREWTEIGEFVISGMTPPTFGFGLERLTLAMAGRYPTWAHRVEHLFRLVRQHAEGGVIPPAVYEFRN